MNGSDGPMSSADTAAMLAEYKRMSNAAKAGKAPPDNIGSSETDMEAPPPKKKRGGKVHGEMPKKRLDKKARGGTIHIKPENKGKLHSKLGVPQGEKIPEAKLEKAKHSSSPAERKEANFAINAKKFKH